jgi:hypothetical protein
MAFAEDLASLLVAANVVPSSSIFTSKKAQIPAGDGPFVSIIDTGGTGPFKVHNRRYGNRRPSAQIVARAKNATSARTTIENCYLTLAGLVNLSVGSVRYIRIDAIQEPLELDLDEVSRARFAFNVNAERTT